MNKLVFHPWSFLALLLVCILLPITLKGLGLDTFGSYSLTFAVALFWRYIYGKPVFDLEPVDE